MSQRTNIIRMRGSLKNSKPWLCFTATADNSSIQLNIIGAPKAISLETSFDGKTWNTYTWNGSTGAAITLAKVDDKVYWRAVSENSTTYAGANYYKFVASASARFNISGNVLSLISKHCKPSDYNEVCFSSMFIVPCNISELILPDRIKTRILNYSFNYFAITGIAHFDKILSCEGNYGLCRTFQQSRITSLILGITEWGKAQFTCWHMNENASLLERIEVKFTEWDESHDQTTDWVLNVAASGMFICPSALDTSVRDSSHVPVGWTIHKRGYFNSADGIFYNDENFTSPAVVVESSTNDEYYIDIPTGDIYAYDGTGMEKVNLE